MIGGQMLFSLLVLDRLGHLITALQLTSLTRGRVMHYAIPETLKKDFGVDTSRVRSGRWAPPRSAVTA